jgi:hypothetical protein
LTGFSDADLLEMLIQAQQGFSSSWRISRSPGSR